MGVRLRTQARHKFTSPIHSTPLKYHTSNKALRMSGAEMDEKAGESKCYTNDDADGNTIIYLPHSSSNVRKAAISCNISH